LLKILLVKTKGNIENSIDNEDDDDKGLTPKEIMD